MGDTQESRPQQPAAQEFEWAVRIRLDLGAQIMGPRHHFQPEMSGRIHDLARLPADQRDSGPQGGLAADDSFQTFTQALDIERTREQHRGGKVEVEIAQPLRVVPVKPLLETQGYRVH